MTITNTINAPTPPAERVTPPVTERSPLVRLGHDVLFVAAGWPTTLVIGMFLGVMAGTSLMMLPAALVGILLLPITLLLGGYAADLTRARYNLWAGHQVLPPLTQRRSFTSFTEYLRACLDLRLWLDLLFEMVVAPTVRFLTGFVLFVWLATGVAFFLAWVPVVMFGATETGSLSFRIGDALNIVGSDAADGLPWLIIDVTAFGLLGLLLLVLFPFILHWAARLEGALTEEALTGRTFPEMRLKGWVTAAMLHVALVGWFILGVSSDSYVMRSDFVLPAAIMCLGLLVATRRAIVGASISVGMYTLVTLHQIVTAPAAMRLREDVWFSNNWPLSIPLAMLFAFLILVIAMQRHDKVAIVTFGAMLATSALGLFGRWVAGDSVEILAGPMILLGLAAIGWLGALAGGIGLRALADGARSSALDREAREAAEAERARAEIARVQAEHESVRSRMRSSELDERARIAREMHDVVAHSMSLISVQAQSAPYRLVESNMDDATRDEFAAIASTSRAALGEMRGLLTVLRGADPHGGSDEQQQPSASGVEHSTEQHAERREQGGGRALNTAPQPTAADIPSLVERTRAAGATVTLTMPDGPCDDVPATAGLTLYRAVQEGLSNALRHAPGAPITIDFTRTPSECRLAITNPAPSEEPHAVPSSGYGLRGVRERASALGGHVDAHKTDDGGFSLTVSLPRQSH